MVTVLITDFAYEASPHMLVTRVPKILNLATVVIRLFTLPVHNIAAVPLGHLHLLFVTH